MQFEDAMTTVSWPPNSPPHLIEKAERHRRNLLAASTRAVYNRSVRDWEQWCTENGCKPYPPSALGLCAHLADNYERQNALGTLRIRVSAIRKMSSYLGLSCEMDDRVRDLLAAFSRTQQIEVKEGLTLDELHQLMDKARVPRRGIRGLRDAAMAAICWHGALRERELGSIRFEHLHRRSAAELKIYIPRSKGDQLGYGQSVTIRAEGGKYCPIAALDAWIKAANLSDGFVFREMRREGRGPNARIRYVDHAFHALTRTLKPYWIEIGLKPAQYSARSLRAGFAIDAYSKGADMNSIRKQLRHKSIITTIRYLRGSIPPLRHASRALGL